jgi:hypothetical protein
MRCPHCGHELPAEYTNQINTAGQPLYLPNPIANAGPAGYGGMITIIANAAQPGPWINTVCAAGAQPGITHYIMLGGGNE